MRNPVLVMMVFFLSSTAWSAEAQPPDLTPFARVTATDTLDSFFLLWPRETDDAAFTVRDGAPETSWKIPYAGTLYLQMDFAPTLPLAPVIASVEAEWETPPNGETRIIASDHCGGPISFESAWTDTRSRYFFDPPVKARCLLIEFSDEGLAALRELKIFGAETEKPLALADAEISPTEAGLRIEWAAKGEAALVRIDYLTNPDESLSDDTLMEIVSAKTDWYGPWPVFEDARIALTPLSVGGVPGETVFLDPPIVGDLPRYPTMGTIEGFYGTPWSDGERRRMMIMLARFGFGSYLYQPKWDLLNREQWRTPYSEEQIAAFGSLRRFGERIGVTMIFGLGPAYDMIVDDADERTILLEKLTPLLDAGFRDFEFGFDDIEFSVTDPVDAVMGARHVDLVNWTRDRLEEIAGESVNLWMMPTPYSTDRQYHSFPAGSDYIDQLADLHEGIRILWNGPDTFAREISAADLEDVTERTGRKPVIWENMHCNDAGDAFIGKFYLAPIMNRATDLPDSVEGFLTNPLIAGAANRLVYGSYEQYFANPSGYDPNLAVPQSVAMEVVDPMDQALARRLSENYWGLGILGPPGNSVTHNRPMEVAMDAVRAVREGSALSPIVEAGARLLNVGAEMASTQNDLHHSGLRTDLVDDLWYPAERLVDEGRAILHMMNWFGARLAGGEDPESLATSEQIIVNSLLHDRYHTSQLRLLAFKRLMERADIVADGFEPPVIAEPASLSAVVGEAWEYETGVTGQLGIHGLRDAAHNGGLIQWRPAHAGTFIAIITATTHTGWAWREFILIVRDAPEYSDDDNEEDDDIHDDDTTDIDTFEPTDDSYDGDSQDGCGC